jgi:ubiquinone/menaquinone biosynthesis C-methylase UbiE
MNCDRLAPFYAWIEYAAFGTALAARRRHFLPRLTHARRALILGGGDGRFLRDLLDANPRVRADYIDRSAAMLARARRAAGTDRVAYHQADALTFPYQPAAYDLIAAHFFFDCFEPADLTRLIQRVRRAAAPGAVWVVSEFRVPRGAWLAPLSRALLAVMYRFFAFTTGLKTRTLADHRPMLVSAGFRLGSEGLRFRGLLVSELWESGAITPW